MTWLWAAALAVVVAAVVPWVLPRVALDPKTRVLWALPIAAVLGAGAGLISRGGLQAGALAYVAGLAAVLIVVDLYEHRLPDTVIIAGLVGWLLFAVASALFMGEWGTLLRSVLAGLAMFAGFFAAALLARGMLGFGDVKLSALLGAVLGWFSWGAVGRGLVFGIILHGLAALVVLAVTRDRKADVPMGPALIAGAVAALFLAS